MKKKLIFLIIVSVLISLFSFGGVTAEAEEAEVYLGGMAVGFKLDNVGATVIGLNDVITRDGLESPAKDAGIKAEDLLISLDGKEINDAKDISDVLSGYDGNGITAVVERDGEVLIKIVYPAKDISGKYRLGLFIRDNICGIGTITFIKQDCTFGSLGHPVVEGENQKPVRINGGDAFACNIIGVNKGVRGKAGEIRGYFIEDEPIGVICENTLAGVFGKITDGSFTDDLRKVRVGKARQGDASIFSTVEGTKPKEYGISIVKVDDGAPENKNLVVKITDEKLLNKTGGILQGMSGSPIVQDGKIVGAVTHVFINDPTRGFGIAIEKMLDI